MCVLRACEGGGEVRTGIYVDCTLVLLSDSVKWKGLCNDTNCDTALFKYSGYCVKSGG